MAIQVGGTTVINNSRALSNIASIDATTAAAIGAAGVGGSVTSGTTVPDPASASTGDLFLDTSTGNPTSGYLLFFSDEVWNRVSYSPGLRPNTVSGEAVFTTAGTHSWTVPTGVNHISVVAVGGGATNNNYGAGGGGGGLCWANLVVTRPGDAYDVIIPPRATGASDGGDTILKKSGATLVTATGGKILTGYQVDAPDGGSYILAAELQASGGGGNGGKGGEATDNNYNGSGGGGAGGYSGNGGNGAGHKAGVGSVNGTNGAGGGGGGGGATRNSSGYAKGGGGGGVGLYGEGSNGVGQAATSTSSETNTSLGGTGGSGGTDGQSQSWQSPAGNGGDYGGGGGSQANVGGGLPAMRIVWKTGEVGSFGFPSTNVT